MLFRSRSKPLRVRRLECTIFAGQKKSRVSDGLEKPKRAKKYLLETSVETESFALPNNK